MTFRTVGTMISPQRKEVAAVGDAEPGDVLGTKEPFPSLVAGFLKCWSFGLIRSDVRLDSASNSEGGRRSGGGYP